MNYYLATLNRPSTGSIIRGVLSSSSQERIDEWLATLYPGWLSLALQLHDDDIVGIKHDIETLNLPSLGTLWKTETFPDGIAEVDFGVDDWQEDD